MRRTRLALIAAALAAAAGPAFACEVPNPLSPQVVADAPVVVRGTLTAIEPRADGSAVLSVDVIETYRGDEAAAWTVTWGLESVIVPPEDLDAFAVAYGGLDIVLGIAPLAVDVLPADPERGQGTLAQEVCAVPFLGSLDTLAPLLRADGLVD
ncbi:MAG: hypothetical protein R3F55_02820 [Alphaproteobacteria bacterium]